VEEEAIPEDYEEDHYEETDPTLLAKYILIGPDHGPTVRLDSEEEAEVDSISSSSSYSSHPPSWKLEWGVKLGVPGGRDGRHPIVTLS